MDDEHFKITKFKQMEFMMEFSMKKTIEIKLQSLNNNKSIVMWKSYLFFKWNSIWLGWFWQINQVIQLHSELKINIIKWTFCIDTLSVRLIGIGSSCYFHVKGWTVQIIFIFAWRTKLVIQNFWFVFFFAWSKIHRTKHFFLLFI